MRLSDLVAAFPGALDGTASAPLHYGSSANGCHACEVEIDPETGQVDVLRYVAVDDFGHVVNEDAVRGQVQGGVMQGIGQALLERAPSPEELAAEGTTRPFRYLMPRATHAPQVEWHDNGLPFRHNVHGAKACSESGASAAPPTVMNAIADALGDHSTSSRVQMPARPARIWRALHTTHHR
jgi:carbon-monoxide dehydrogenase large subunit